MLNGYKRYVITPLVIFVLFFLCSCQMTEDHNTNINICSVISANENAENYMETVEQWLPDQEKHINEVLAEYELPYSVQLDIIIEPEKESAAEAYASYDLLYFSSDLTLQELEEYFIDLKSELENGSLQTLYQSMPEQYWRTLEVNGHIFNTVRLQPVQKTAVFVNESILRTFNLEVPEGSYVSGENSVWETFLAEVFSKNEKKPFFSNTFLFNLKMFGLQEHFQMVGPYIGISYEEPEKGVQCIFESNYCRDTLKSWQELVAKQYVQCYSYEEYEEYFGEKGFLESIMGMTIFSDDGREGEFACYPVQKTSYAYPIHSERYLDPDYPYYQLLVPQSCMKQELVFQFLNDMASDRELAAQIHEIPDAVSYPVFYLTPASGIKDAVGESSFLDEPLKENQQTQWQSYASLKEVPAQGFVFNEEPVQTTIDKLMQLSSFYLGEENPFIELTSGAANWDHYKQYIDDFVAELYDNGMQEVIDEANRQLAAYNKN